MYEKYRLIDACSKVEYNCNKNSATYTASLIGKQISWGSLSSTLLQVATPVESGRCVASWGMETMIILLTPSRWKYVH